MIQIWQKLLVMHLQREVKIQVDQGTAAVEKSLCFIDVIKSFTLSTFSITLYNSWSCV